MYYYTKTNAQGNLQKKKKYQHRNQNYTRVLPSNDKNETIECLIAFIRVKYVFKIEILIIVCNRIFFFFMGK